VGTDCPSIKLANFLLRFVNSPPPMPSINVSSPDIRRTYDFCSQLETPFSGARERTLGGRRTIGGAWQNVLSFPFLFSARLHGRSIDHPFVIAFASYDCVRCKCDGYPSPSRGSVRTEPFPPNGTLEVPGDIVVRTQRTSKKTRLAALMG
jgi:hypothetical protein